MKAAIDLNAVSRISTTLRRPALIGSEQTGDCLTGTDDKRVTQCEWLSYRFRVGSEKSNGLPSGAEHTFSES